MKEIQNPMAKVHALLNVLRVSPYKLNHIAKTIRRKNVNEALQILRGTRKRSAKDVEKTLLSAASNAQNNHGLDVDSLFVVEATVGKSIRLKRMDIKGRSRMGKIIKPFSQIRITLSQIETLKK